MTFWRSIFYFGLATLFSLSTLYPSYEYSWLLKISPIILLMLSTWQKKHNKLTLLFLVGLLCSACGDVLLDFDRDNLFIWGLGAFFVAHLFYLAAIFPLEKKRAIFIMFYLVYGVGIAWLLLPNLGELLIPVVAYMSVLLLMGMSTVLSRKTNAWLVLGGLSFVISDSIIGLNKFYSPIPDAHLLIMVTYYFAQFALFKGVFYQQQFDNRRIFT